MTTLLWTVGTVALCAGLLYAAHRIEPHWVAKDGARFLTTSDRIDRFGQTVGRRREVRGVFLPDGVVMISKRSLIKSDSSLWRIAAKSPSSPPGRQLFLLQPVTPSPEGETLVLRMPAKSRLVALLDGRAAGGAQRSAT